MLKQAYFKMNNVLIDDRRIKVDFSQSVSHLWKQFKRFGRKGNVDLASEADTHQRQQADAGGAQSLAGAHVAWVRPVRDFCAILNRVLSWVYAEQTLCPYPAPVQRLCPCPCISRCRAFGEV